MLAPCNRVAPHPRLRRHWSLVSHRPTTTTTTTRREPALAEREPVLGDDENGLARGSMAGFRDKQG